MKWHLNSNVYSFHQVFLPHSHPLSLLQGSTAGPPSDDPGHSALEERAAVQDCRGVCFTTHFPHRDNIVEFSFPANPERLHCRGHSTKATQVCVMTEIPDTAEVYSCLLRGGKKYPTHTLTWLKQKGTSKMLQTSRLLIWKIKDLLINWKYIFKTIKIADWRYCERQMQYLLLCVPNPALVYRIKWNYPIKILFQNYISIAEKVISSWKSWFYWQLFSLTTYTNTEQTEPVTAATETPYKARADAFCLMLHLHKCTRNQATFNT